MPKPITPPSRCPRRWIVFAVVLIAPLFTFPTVALAEDTYPVIHSVTVSPGSLGHQGGQITITVDATDDVGISAVSASTYSPDGAIGSVDLHPSGASSYSGTFLIPANYTDSPVQWGIEAWVTDTQGASTSYISGGVEVAAQPQFDEPPVVSDPSVTPRELPNTGGQVTIAITASDLRGISSVYAAVKRPDGTTDAVELLGVSSSRFEGIYTAPSNSGTTPLAYTVSAAAADDIGQETWVDAGSFTVAGRSVATTVKLSASPRVGLFGLVKVGRTTQRNIVVCNARKNSAPLSGVASVNGSSFTLAGSSNGGVRITLATGECKTLRVVFRPASKGLKDGVLSIRADSERRPALNVRLLGVGRR
jgi:hypothetical protein